MYVLIFWAVYGPLLSYDTMISIMIGKRKEIAIVGQFYKSKDKCGDENQVW
jgi:hypothetical protein